MRQAYDYWQDQPGISTSFRPHRLRTSTVPGNDTGKRRSPDAQASRALGLHISHSRRWERFSILLLPNQIPSPFAVRPSFRGRTTQNSQTVVRPTVHKTTVQLGPRLHHHRSPPCRGAPTVQHWVLASRRNTHGRGGICLPLSLLSWSVMCCRQPHNPDPTQTRTCRETRSPHIYSYYISTVHQP